MTSTATTIDAAIEALTEGAVRWAATPLAERGLLLRQVHDLTARHAQDWVDIAVDIKGLPKDSPLVGEEWVSGPYPVITGTGALIESLAALDAGRSPLDGFEITAAPGDRSAVHVLPHGIFDRLLLNGFTAEVWTKPGIGAETVRARAGSGARTPARDSGVAVVLGAGNIFSIPPLDLLYQLIADNRVVALKLNPITDPLLPVFERIFAPLIERGFLRILTGGAEVGTALVNHPDVTSVHMTGSSNTHDAIVFGPGAEGARRRAANTPLLAKPITSELGGVSPTIVLPGQWSEADLRFQAEHLATQRLHNNGYNCVASQVAIVSADWPQKEKFLAELRAAFDRAPERPAYYPGSENRVANARKEYPRAQRVGPNNDRTLVLGISPSKDEPALREEYFSPVFGVTELPGTGPEFLRAAVDVSNEEFVGTLGVNIIAHPKTLRQLGAALDKAIADLRYGTVAINAWTGVGYLTARASWGAFPGHTLDDVQSGIGVVHNALLIDDPERTVVRGPFRPAPRSITRGEFTLAPKPPWFVTNRTAATTGRLLAYFSAAPGWSKLPAIFASALRG
ncbi:aldehyde dehydrogenase family protein [Nocardia fluminea]|uniref:Aldehyde dehydrogenase (NAD(P)+) n=1 Tax=Nocardia fluminea TaxID=134984 RepID=A0A2N3WXA0_9NOCA|nr:aldehyde dehydrogenase family protein [Nocardia fluminea]PKV98521.1 aldehyde dehydrogenase (NAD(P)+) [Nocardia fluminea]